MSLKYINKEQTLTDQILELHFTARHLNNWLNQKKFIFLSQKFINKEQTPINQTSEPLFMVRHLKNWLSLKKSVSLSQKFIKIEQTLINQTSELHSTLQSIVKTLNSEFERNESLVRIIFKHLYKFIFQFPFLGVLGFWGFGDRGDVLRTPGGDLNVEKCCSLGNF